MSEYYKQNDMLVKMPENIWIPIDPDNKDYQEFLALRIGVDSLTEIPKSLDDIKLEYANAMREEFRLKALEREYDNEQSIMSYINSSNAQWQAEAQAYNKWRDACWSYAINIYESGQIPALNDFINNLPAINWP